MPYCAKCGVEVENNVEGCPLCQFPIPDIEHYNEVHTKFPDPENSYPLKMLAKKKKWLSIVTTVYFIIGSLLLFIDYNSNQLLEWSKYAVISLMASWVYVFLLFGFIKNFLANLFIFSVNTLALTLALDYVFDYELNWFYSLSMPIVVMFTLLSMLFAFLFSKTRRKGINVVSFILLPASFYCIGTEAFISKYILGRVVLYWSIIVLIAALPISFLLLYLHYGIPEKYWVKLKRKFHF